jgi:hypothetical protein
MKLISASLVKAQKEFGPALKTATNPHFRSKYADLSACIEAVIDALNNNGIMLMQPTHLCESGVIVETIFLHESGEQLSGGKLHVPASKHDAQGYGSALSYARRYSLMAACGIAPEEDDGNAASKTAPKPVATLPKPEPKATGKAPTKVEGRDGPWQIAVEVKAEDDLPKWIETVLEVTRVALQNAQTQKDVMDIFKVNRNIFDKLKAEAPEDHTSLMADFKTKKDKMGAQ